MKRLQVPAGVVSRIVAALREDAKESIGKVNSERSRLQTRLTCIRNPMDQAYTDELDGAIPEGFWQGKMNDWREEESQVKMALNALDSTQTDDRALDAEKIFDLANKALFAVHFAEFSRIGQSAQNACFEPLRKR